MSPVARQDGRTLAKALMLVTGAIASCTSFSDAVDPGTGSTFEHGGSAGTGSSAGKGGSVSNGGAGGGGGKGGATGGGGGTGGSNKGGMGGSSGGQAGSATGGSAGSAGATGTGGSGGAAGAPTPGSPVDVCMKAVNAHRTAAGLKAFTRWDTGEACACSQAQAVAGGQASPDLGKCGAWAGTICTDWPGPPETMVEKCVDQIWADSGPSHDYMASTAYTQIACGFFENPQTKVWALQLYR